MEPSLPILLRPANKDDIGFVFNAWLKSFRGADFARNMQNEIFYSEHHKIIENILKHYNVIIACNKEDTNQIYGFICAGHTEGIFTMHYIYVKNTFRRMGIAKELLKAFDHDMQYAAIYTHHGKSAKFLAQKYNFVYHPYIALSPETYAKLENSKSKKTKK